jgi:hypothetical protein
MKIIDLYKHISWKIKYESGDMTYPPIFFWKKNISLKSILSLWGEISDKLKENN